MTIQIAPSWSERIKQAFISPNGKQKEAFGRFFHTVSIACLVGSVTVTVAEPSLTYQGYKIGLLMVCFAMSFILGSIFSKGE